MKVGVGMSWLAPRECITTRMNRTGNEEQRERNSYTVTKALFADDTTIYGERAEMKEGKKIFKRCLKNFEEQCHEGKEEHLALGISEGGEFLILGTGIGRKQDAQKRKKRGRYVLMTIKKRLKNTKLTEKTQATVVQLVMESIMLLHCETSAWQKKEVRELQRVVDQEYRYICMDKRGGPALQQTEEKRMNMWGVRRDLGVKYRCKQKLKKEY